MREKGETVRKGSHWKHFLYQIHRRICRWISDRNARMSITHTSPDPCACNRKQYSLMDRHFFYIYHSCLIGIFYGPYICIYGVEQKKRDDYILCVCARHSNQTYFYRSLYLCKVLATVILGSWECHIFMIVKKIFVLSPFTHTNFHHGYFHFKNATPEKKNQKQTYSSYGETHGPKNKTKVSGTNELSPGVAVAVFRFASAFLYFIPSLLPSVCVFGNRFKMKYKKARNKIMSEKSSVMSLLLKFARKNSHATCHETGEMGIFRFFSAVFLFLLVWNDKCFSHSTFFFDMFTYSPTGCGTSHTYTGWEREKYK